MHKYLKQLQRHRNETTNKMETTQFRVQILTISLIISNVADGWTVKKVLDLHIKFEHSFVWSFTSHTQKAAPQQQTKWPTTLNISIKLKSA